MDMILWSGLLRFRGLINASEWQASLTLLSSSGALRKPIRLICLALCRGKGTLMLTETTAITVASPRQTSSNSQSGHVAAR